MKTILVVSPITSIPSIPGRINNIRLTTRRPSINTVATSNFRPLLMNSSSTSFPKRSITRNRSLVDLWSNEPEPKNMGTPRCFRFLDLHQLFTVKKRKTQNLESTFKGDFCFQLTIKIKNKHCQRMFWWQPALIAFICKLVRWWWEFIGQVKRDSLSISLERSWIV